MSRGPGATGCQKAFYLAFDLIQRLEQTVSSRKGTSNQRFLTKLMQKMQDVQFRRRSLPSLRSIVAFEAAARTQSFARAATELSLSQSAISRQIAQLEESLGVDLFSRVRQRVTLTPAGDFFAERVRDIMKRLRAASSETMAFQDGGGLLRLGVLPTFGTKWLIPRISRFISANPGVTLYFNTRLPGVFDFDASDLDATIHFGAPVWPGVTLHLLRNDETAVVIAPDLRDTLAVEKPTDVLRGTLIGQGSRPDDWPDWLTAHGVTLKSRHPVIEFEQFNMVIQAATSGLGIAIVPTFMVRTELQSGALVQLFDPLVSQTRGDYLAYPDNRENYPPLVAFREWLLETMVSDP